jgi:hypothetical protein
MILCNRFKSCEQQQKKWPVWFERYAYLRTVLDAKIRTILKVMIPEHLLSCYVLLRLFLKVWETSRKDWRSKGSDSKPRIPACKPAAPLYTHIFWHSLYTQAGTIHVISHWTWCYNTKKRGLYYEKKFWQIN